MEGIDWSESASAYISASLKSRGIIVEEMEVAWRRCLGDCRYGGIKGRYLGDGS